MNLLITGANGFLGKYILEYFTKTYPDYYIATLGRNKTNDFCIDLTTSIPNFNISHFDSIIHVAGLAHFTPRNSIEERLFYDINEEKYKNRKGLRVMYIQFAIEYYLFKIRRH
jgi:nucleoside-diphosphate-sugar epimerase